MMLPLLANLLGKTEEEAIQLIEKEKLIARIVHRNGEDYMVTMDFCVDRVNLSINHGKVTKAHIV